MLKKMILLSLVMNGIGSLNAMSIRVLSNIQKQSKNEYEREYRELS